jgi:hypothetical protein
MSRLTRAPGGRGPSCRFPDSRSRKGTARRFDCSEKESLVLVFRYSRRPRGSRYFFFFSQYAYAVIVGPRTLANAETTHLRLPIRFDLAKKGPVKSEG